MAASDHLSSKQFYHVSPAYNKEDILSQGLDPQSEPNDWGSKIKRRVFLTPSKEDAYKWGEQVEATHGDSTKMSLFKVDASQVRTRKRKTDIGLIEHSTSSVIEPSHIQHVEDFFPHERKG